MTAQAIISERARTHGDFTAVAGYAQELKRLVTNSKMHSYEREALEMIASKIARILAGDPHFKDHWIDIAGYAQLVADRCPS